jgi:hypothetical protein
MTTTTTTAIIERIVEVIQGLQPDEIPARRFKESTAPNLPLATWANDAGANGLFRLFEVRRNGQREDPGINHPSATLAAVPLLVKVCYPAVPRLYQLPTNRALEALIESDAHQIRDALEAPTALVAGHLANMTTIEALTQGERMWFQDISISTVFYIAQRR